MPEPSPLLPCLCLFYFSTVLSSQTHSKPVWATRPTTHTLSRHKYSTYNPVRCTVRFPNLTRSILSQNIRTATPLLKKLPPCVPLSRPLHLCTKKPNLFAFPFHKYSTYSPVRCAVRLPSSTPFNFGSAVLAVRRHGVPLTDLRPILENSQAHNIHHALAGYGAVCCTVPIVP